MRLIAILIPFFLICSQAHVFAISQNLTSEILIYLDTHQILILGETHKKPESTKLLTELVTQYTSTGGCLSLALEIDSDQQEILNQALRGTKPISDIYITQIIDHPAYREMLEDLGALVRHGRCMSVHAVDAVLGSGTDRDIYMADRVGELADKGKVLMLVGSNHAYKKLKWTHRMDTAPLAERLVRQGYEVASVVQEWDYGQGSCSGALVDMDADLANHMLDTLAIYPPKDPSGIVDKALLYGCAKQQQIWH